MPHVLLLALCGLNFFSLRPFVWSFFRRKSLVLWNGSFIRDRNHNDYIITSLNWKPVKFRMATLQLANSTKNVSGGKFSWIECWEPRICWLQVLLVRTIWVKCLGHCAGMWEDSLKGRKRSTRKSLVQPTSISSLMCLKSCCRCYPEDGGWWHLWSLQQPPGRVGNSHDSMTSSRLLRIAGSSD